MSRPRYRPGLRVSTGILALSLGAILGLIGLAGCGGGGGGRAAGAPLKVTTTTGMVGDLVERLGGPHVRVTRLMGPGVDPHLYKAGQADLERLSGADLIAYNGLHLEGKMVEIFEKMARTKPTLAVTKDLPEELLRTPPEFAGAHDPHVWFDVSLWRRCLETVAAELTRLDPGHAAEFAARRAEAAAEFDSLHAWCRSELATVPEARRVLITAHDAFGYFGRAYGVEVVGLQGISTVSEFGLNDVNRLVDLIVSRGIPAVFVESSVSPRSIEALVQGCAERGHTVRIGGTLFSDAMGADGTPEASYPGMVRHNVRTIVEALR